MLRTMLALGALALATGAAHAVDPAEFGGGACKEMVQAHEPATLWVGRFAAEANEGGEGGENSAVACFTAHDQCIAWIDRESGSGDWGNIYQMSCHKGL